ncbi:UPF0481 protein [Rosa sericea]
MEGNIVAAPTDIENPYDPLETLIKKVDSLPPPSPLRCIYRVPYRLRRVREEAYTPRVISIGPFHHGNEALKAMEDHKTWYLKCFMARTGSKLNDYARKIKAQEKKLRSWYGETIVRESDEFVTIILVDAIFVIEFLRRYADDKLQDKNDCIFGKPRMVEDIMTDLLMLENQLPFFILKDLFDPNMIEVPSVEKLSIQFLHKEFSVGITTFGGMLVEDLSKKIDPSKEEVQHLVDLLRKLWIAPLSNEPSMTKQRKSATEKKKSATAPGIEKLQLGGVKFKVKSDTNLFDIRFDKGILMIPRLEIGDATEIILRNLIAFEQCSTTSDDYYISDYVSIMDELVDTPKDVELLVKNKIVKNDLGGGDHALSSLINRLSTGIIYDSTNFYYGDLCGNLYKFHSRQCNHIWAILWRDYFNTPWAIISFVAAVVVIIFTAVQTICSIISLK